MRGSRHVTESGAFSRRWAARYGARIDKRLARKLVRFCGPTFVDIGAGAGAYVRILLASGKTGYGVDGIQDVERITDGRVLFADLRHPVQGLESQHTGICVEVGEHIAPEYEDVFWQNVNELSSARLILSWATPGQRGRGHVNCRAPGYVRERIEALGFAIDQRATEGIRAKMRGNWAYKLWVAGRQ